MWNRIKITKSKNSSFLLIGALLLNASCAVEFNSLNTGSSTSSGTESLTFAVSRNAAPNSGTVTLTASGGDGSYTYTVESGTGSISSNTYTAAASGYSAVTIKATDSQGNFASTTVDVLGAPFFWMRADSLSSSLADGADVVTWDDQSTNSNDITSPTAGQRPTFYLNGGTDHPNSQPYVSYDETTNDCMFSGSASPALSNYTLFAVFRDDTTATGFENIVSMTYTSGVNIARYGANANDFGSYLLGTSNTSHHNSFTDNSSWYVIALRRTTALVELYRDGNTVDSATKVSTATSAQNIGVGCSPDNSLFYGGDITETILYQTNLSDGELSTVGCYLGNKYGITMGHGC